MKISYSSKLFLKGGLVLMAFFMIGLLAIRSGPVRPDSRVALEIPPFIGSAQADTLNNITQSISAEAGIAAYFQAPMTINLADVRGFYKIIEDETATYIIGAMAVPDYGVSEDLHVYIHTDGWVLAYYLNDETIGKIYDWVRYDGATITTKFEPVFETIAITIGMGAPALTYYDFRYPEATKLLLTAEKGIDNSFEIKLPGAYTYYERGWSLYASSTRTIYYYLDDVQLGSAYNSSMYNTLTLIQLPPDVFHTFRMDSYYSADAAGLALIYKE